MEYAEADIVSNRHVKRDLNHADIVRALEQIGVGCFDGATFGNGFPDLLTAYRGKIRLIEIKNSENAYGRAGLNALQAQFASFLERYGCEMYLIESVDEALRLHGARV